MSHQSAASLEDYMHGKQVTPGVLAEDGLKWCPAKGVGVSCSRHRPKVNCLRTFPHPYLPLSKTFPDSFQTPKVTFCFLFEYCSVLHLPPFRDRRLHSDRH